MCLSGHMRTAKAQISLRRCAGWSGPSLFAYGKIKYSRIYWRFTGALIKLCWLAGRSESLVLAYTPKSHFPIAWRFWQSLCKMVLSSLVHKRTARDKISLRIHTVSSGFCCLSKVSLDVLNLQGHYVNMPIRKINHHNCFRYFLKPVYWLYISPRKHIVWIVVRNASRRRF